MTTTALLRKIQTVIATNGNRGVDSFILAFSLAGYGLTGPCTETTAYNQAKASIAEIKVGLMVYQKAPWCDANVVAALGKLVQDFEQLSPPDATETPEAIQAKKLRAEAAALGCGTMLSDITNDAALCNLADDNSDDVHDARFFAIIGDEYRRLNEGVTHYPDCKCSICR